MTLPIPGKISIFPEKFCCSPETGLVRVVIPRFLVLKTISFLFVESVVESYHLERLRQQELRLKIILRWARVGQFATDL